MKDEKIRIHANVINAILKPIPVNCSCEELKENIAALTSEAIATNAVVKYTPCINRLE